MLITWTASSVSIRRGLYFFTHENPAQQLFSPYAKPSHGAHYQELKYINQRNWFVHIKQNIFCFCQLRKWHLPLMPLCWFFQAFDFYELHFWAWWLQPQCGSEQHARPPRVSRALFSLFASVIPVGLARKFLLRSSLPRITVPFLMLFKLPRALWLIHEPLPSRFTFPSFLPSLSLYFFLLHLLCSSYLPLTHLHLPSLPFPGCLSPGWRQQRVVLSRV